ncbi:MAG TPA: hypothetical protein VNA16_03620, partial [Abditibacteriaceae bacterium]|nr:hypothetical protein [Abditibacteriaceae bacterium]
MNQTNFEAFIIEPEEAGQRLDVLVASRLGVSRARAQKLLESATVNGVAAKSSHLLKSGDAVAVPGRDNRTATAPVPGELAVPLPPILFEDEHLLVLDKPRGLAVHPGAGEQQITLVDVLRASGRQLSGVGPEERAGIV